MKLTLIKKQQLLLLLLLIINVGRLCGQETEQKFEEEFRKPYLNGDFSKALALVAITAESGIPFHKNPSYKKPNRIWYLLMIFHGKLESFEVSDSSSCNEAESILNELDSLYNSVKYHERVAVNDDGFREKKDSLIEVMRERCTRIIQPPPFLPEEKGYCEDDYTFEVHEGGIDIKISIKRCEYIKGIAPGFESGVYLGLEPFYERMVNRIEKDYLRKYKIPKSEVQLVIWGHSDGEPINEEGIKLQTYEGEDMCLYGVDLRQITSTEKFRHVFTSENGRQKSENVDFFYEICEIRNNLDLCLVRAYLALKEFKDLTTTTIHLIAVENKSIHGDFRKVEIGLHFPNKVISDALKFENQLKRDGFKRTR